MSYAESLLITKNKKAFFDYHIEDEYNAGLVLEGWEVKSLRSGKVNITGSYVILKYGEAFLFGADIQPLPTVTSYWHADPTRTRKLLLKRRELNRLIGCIERQGYTVIPLRLFWERSRVKITLALAKGKKTYDKRDSEKARDWQRSRARLLKNFRD